MEKDVEFEDINFEDIVKQLRDLMDKIDINDILQFFDTIRETCLEKGWDESQAMYLIGKVAGLKFEGDDDEKNKFN